MRSITIRAIIRIVLLLGVFLSGRGEEEIKWTPNDDAENAPLPLSMNQRQQLLQLEQAIMSSPDPNGTLQQVAEQNGMSPQDLVNMLDKNARDLSQDPSLLQPTTVVSVISKALASASLIASQSAKKNPRAFALSVSLFLFVIYARIMIPRTGLHVSAGSMLFSPSQTYLQKIADSQSLSRCPLSIKAQKMNWEDLKIDLDGIEVHKLSRKSELSQAISARYTLAPEDFFEDDLVETDLDVNDEVLELLFEKAAYVLSERQWAEFAPGSRPLKSAVSGQKNGVLLVPGLGVMGRYGLIRWRCTQQMEMDKLASATLTSLRGDFFDGQIHVQVQRRRSKIVFMIHLAVQKRGRKMNKKCAMKLVNDMIESIGASTSQRTRQNLARRSVGKRFKLASNQRASERRNSRFEREKEIEEMSEDRRRKWQRGNPDAGRWRPTGDRMRGLEGGPSRSF